MAFSTIKSVLVVFLVLHLCSLMLLQPSSGCMTGQQGCLYDDINFPKNLNRKMLLKSNLEKNKVVVNGPKTETGGEGMVVGWELRKAPLGPDPLHHHGASPKKPGTKSP